MAKTKKKASTKKKVVKKVSSVKKENTSEQRIAKMENELLSQKSEFYEDVRKTWDKIREVEQRIDRLVDALSKSKKVKGL